MPAGKFYLRNAANDAWISIAQGAGAAGGGSATGDYIPEDGWVEIDDTLTYASATTFTVATDLTSTYQKGTKLKLTQTTVKYFYVVSSTYGAPNTTVTITGGDDYTLASAAITTPYYSYIENPQGFPDWFNYTPTITAGGSMTVSSPAINFAKFSISGQKVILSCFVEFTLGGSAHTSVYITSPVNTALSSILQIPGAGNCNTAGGTVTAMINLSGSTNLIIIRRYDGTNWTTGASRALTVNMTYPL